MIGQIAPPATPAGNIPPSFVTGDSDPLVLGGGNAPELTLPPGSKVELTQEKILNVTKIGGLRGSVKEMAGLDDWQITFSFTLISPTYSPGFVDRATDSAVAILAKLKEIRQLWLNEEPIAVTNERLNLLGIDHVVLKRIDIPDNETIWKQPITLNAISDEGVDVEKSELEIKSQRTSQ